MYAAVFFNVNVLVVTLHSLQRKIRRKVAKYFQLSGVGPSWRHVAAWRRSPFRATRGAQLVRCRADAAQEGGSRSSFLVNPLGGLGVQGWLDQLFELGLPFSGLF